jgi:uncharacterized membrane protein (TIGR02234 family)
MAIAAVGVGSAAIALWASTGQWFITAARDKVPPAGDGDGQVPGATALALVILADWGVILVSRGPWRRLVATVAVVASVGLVGTIWWASSAIPMDLRDDLTVSGIESGSVWMTRWFWLAILGATGSVLASAAAVWTMGAWPTMSPRYDAPQVQGPDGYSEQALAPRSARELWTELSHGRDPTG